MTALEDLAALRTRLVTSRRDAVQNALAVGADYAQWSIALVTLQERIDAVDRAILDEQKK